MVGKDLSTRDRGSMGVPVLLSVGLGTFMSALDASVVHTVLPVIRTSYHASVATIQWVPTAYLLVMGCLLLTFGRLGDLRGHKRVYLAGFGVFLPASVLCGVSPTIEVLIAARLLQGLGAAILVSTSAAILMGSVHPSRLGQALGIQAAMVSVGLALGPSFGGWLTDRFGWGSIFFINVPIGATAFLLGLRHIAPDGKKPSRGERFDTAGALLFMGAFLALQFALNRGNLWGWGSAPTLGVLALSSAFGVLFVRRETGAASPMLDLSLFGNRLFSYSVGSALVNYVCMASVLFLTPFYLIQGRGLSASTAGLFMTAQSLAMVAAAPVSGRIADRIGSRVPATVGIATQGAGLFILSALGGESPLVLALAGLVVAGLGMAVFAPPNNSAMLGAAPDERKGIASGILATSRLLGLATGIGLAGAVLAGFVGHAPGGGLPPDRLYKAVRLGFLAAGLMAVAGAFLTAARGKSGVRESRLAANEAALPKPLPPAGMSDRWSK